MKVRTWEEALNEEFDDISIVTHANVQGAMMIEIYELRMALNNEEAKNVKARRKLMDALAILRGDFDKQC